MIKYLSDIEGFDSYVGDDIPSSIKTVEDFIGYIYRNFKLVRVVQKLELAVNDNAPLFRYGWYNTYTKTSLYIGTSRKYDIDEMFWNRDSFGEFWIWTERHYPDEGLLHNDRWKEACLKAQETPLLN